MGEIDLDLNEETLRKIEDIKKKDPTFSEEKFFAEIVDNEYKRIKGKNKGKEIK